MLTLLGAVSVNIPNVAIYLTIFKMAAVHHLGFVIL